jgi:capsular polysaccharide biosynthesis protein
MRATAYAELKIKPASPWRKLFISRADSRARSLVNEAEIAECAAKTGFERIVLSALSVQDQIRLFAEATHVIAAHGAGLANLIFCRPGTVVCEMHSEAYVQWAFRSLAGLRQLRYGCVIGQANEGVSHHRDWRMDPVEFAAVLADPRFTGN